jgi:hypothetical protein
MTEQFDLYSTPTPVGKLRLQPRPLTNGRGNGHTAPLHHEVVAEVDGRSVRGTPSQRAAHAAIVVRRGVQARPTVALAAFHSRISSSYVYRALRLTEVELAQVLGGLLTLQQATVRKRFVAAVRAVGGTDAALELLSAM